MTNAELFTMASAPETSREVFINSVTLSAQDNADGCIDLDAEKARLSRIWELAHLSMKEIISLTGMSQTAFAKGAGIPLRTVQDWYGEKRACPSYVRFLLAEHYGLI